MSHGWTEAFLRRYEILGKLGSGGMGTVLLGRQKALGREVAIKRMDLPDPIWRQRFLREGKLMARLRHPNLVQVFEAGEDDGCPYLVMEVVKGGTLDEQLARQETFDLSAALAIGLQVAAGVALAHSEGILHRDLKPANILVASGGTIKVADFGLARDTLSQEELTGAGVVMGTPGYLAPELMRGDEASPASDVYALGCVLTELLTGAAPYSASGLAGDRRGLAELLRIQASAPVPRPSEGRSGLPAELDELVFRCLSTLPAERPVDAGEVEKSLAALTERLGAASSWEPARGKRNSPLMRPPAEGAGQTRAIRRRPAGATRVPQESPPRRQPPAVPRPVRGLLAGSVVAVAALALLWALPSRRLPADGQEPPVRQETPAPRPAEKVQSLAPPAALSAAGKSSKGYPRFFNEKDGSHLILIPAGPFRMGSDAPGSAKDEGPSLLVTLPDYLIGEKEVTWKQYARFCGATSRRLPARPAGAGEVHPVVGIRWADAVAYCDWAGFRLPTEAEWEKAARGTGGHVYPWGDEAPSEARACFDRLMVGQSEPVGSYPAGASPFGALDMAGNVWEWCADWYDPEAYRRAPRRDGVLAPKGPSSGKDRVVRGGSWFNQGETLRVSYRYGTRPDFGGPYYGFRVARTSP